MERRKLFHEMHTVSLRTSPGPTTSTGPFMTETRHCATGTELRQSFSRLCHSCSCANPAATTGRPCQSCSPLFPHYPVRMEAREWSTLTYLRARTHTCTTHTYPRTVHPCFWSPRGLGIYSAEALLSSAVWTKSPRASDSSFSICTHIQSPCVQSLGRKPTSISP